MMTVVVRALCWITFLPIQKFPYHYEQWDIAQMATLCNAAFGKYCETHIYEFIISRDVRADQTTKQACSILI